MKKRTLILAVLAVVLVLSASIGSAVAYFTTYATARGGYVIHLGGRTEIEEDIVNNRKTVRIAVSGSRRTTATGIIRSRSMPGQRPIPKAP